MAPVVEESPTRTRRPRRLVDLLPVLPEGPSTTSMAARAQNIVELYGVRPPPPKMLALALFLLRSASQPQAWAWYVHRNVHAQRPKTIIFWVLERPHTTPRLSAAQTASWLRGRSLSAAAAAGSAVCRAPAASCAAVGAPLAPIFCTIEM